MSPRFRLRALWSRPPAHLSSPTFFWLICAALLALLSESARAGGGFNPRFNHNVYATAVHPNGGLLVGGAFYAVQSAGSVTETGHLYLARLRPDGTVDESFDVQLDGDVTALAVQPDGRILVGGKFTQYRNSAMATGIPRRGLLRLNADGSLDTAFVAHVTGQPLSANAISALALQADGRILIGGAFTAVQGATDAAPVSRRRIARLNANGTLDPTFDPGANNFVFAILVQPDQRIVIGGGFTTLQPNGGAIEERKRLARLNPDGSLDPDFRPRADNRVLALARQANGMIVVGGDFRTWQTDADESALSRNFLARIRTDGSIDGDFDPDANGSVAVLLPTADGSLIAGGSFTQLRPSAGAILVARRYLARIAADGSIDETFNPQPNAPVAALAVQNDGQVVVGGYFTGLQPGSASAVTPRYHLARLASNGALDGPLGLDAGGFVAAVARQADGRWLLGGTFSQIAGITRQNLARIENDGVLDSSFAPEINGQVESVVIQPDGKILIGGLFTTVNSADYVSLARLNADGSLDTAFHPQPNGAVYSILLQSDGRILVGGSFAGFDTDNDDTTAVVARHYLARLNADGSLDDSFLPGTDGLVHSLVLQSDGQLLVGGSFSTLQGTGETPATRTNIGRLRANSTLDTTFNPTANSAVLAMALQSDGQIVVSGAFTSFNPGNVSTATPIIRGRLARLKSDGTVDSTFDPNPNGLVQALWIDASNRIYLGGTFLTIGPAVRQRLARLTSSGAVDSTFTVNTNEGVFAFAGEPSGRLLVAGAFTVAQVDGGQPIDASHHVFMLNTAGTPDSGFRVRATASQAGAAQALALQPDGQLLVGGQFTQFAGQANRNLVRFNENNALDTTFNPKPDGTVHAVLVRPESSDIGPGKLFAVLKSDGTIDSTFALQAISQLSGQINTVIRQADGKIVVGGSFTDKSAGAGYRLARYFPDGTVDTAFNPAPDGAVSALALQPDGKLLVGGAFLNIAGQVRHYIARLNPDGSIDGTFNPKANAVVSTFAVQPDGRILIGGAFTSLDPNSTDDADTDVTTRSYLARINGDGTVDSGFSTAASSAVRTLVLLESGQILVGGTFSTMGDQTRNGLARLSATGAVESFNPNVNGTVNALVRQSDGKIVAGGIFTTANPNSTDTTTAITRNNLARFNDDGTLDTSFDPGTNAAVNTLALSEDGRIYVGGLFTTVTATGSSEAVNRSRIARLTTDGSIDTGFNPNANGPVQQLVAEAGQRLLMAGAFTQIHPEGVLWIAGEFSQIGGATLPRLARLNLDGNADSTFQPAPDAPVYALARQPDGALLAAGAFTQISGVARSRLARFSAAGILDGNFAPQVDNTVSTLAVQADGRVLLGGAFTAVNGTARSRLARLATNGSVDTTYSASANGPIVAIVLQTDGKAIVAGAFTQINGVARTGLARLNADGSLDTSFAVSVNGSVVSLAALNDGGLIIGGSFTQVGGVARLGWARLSPDGTLDASVSVPTDGEVRALAVRPDGTVVLAGAFTTVANRSRTLIAEITPTQTVSSSLTVSTDLRTLTWTQRGPGPALTTIALEYSSDRYRWTPLGIAQRSPASTTWSLTTPSALPAANVYYVRVQATAPTTRQASSGLFAWVAQFYGPQPAGAVIAGTLEGDEVAQNTGDTPVSSSSDPAESAGSGASGSGGVTTGESSGGGVAVGVQPARLVNLSVRIALPPGGVVITGLSVPGDSPQRVLLRAVGPGLKSFGVDPAMAQPQLQLFDSQGHSLQSVAGWSPDLAATFTQVGAFALTPGAGDAAMAVTLPPGSYTVHASDRQGSGGVVLIEAYAAPNDTGVTPQLSTLAARGPAAGGAGVLIAGLAIGGDQPQRLLLRGIGPTLANFGVTTPVSDPVLQVFDSQGRLVQENDNWSANASLAATLRSVYAEAGAFTLPEASADAALVLTLAPGSYTLQLTPRQGSTGEGLIEVYSLK